MAAQGDAKATYDKLKAEYDKAGKAYTSASRALQQTDEYKKARDDRDRAAMNKLRATLKRPDADGAITKSFETAAAKYAGTDDCVQFLVWLSLSSPNRAAKKIAAETIASKHLGSAAIGEFLENVNRLQRDLGKDRVTEILETVIAKSGHDLMKASAHFSIASAIRVPRGSTLPPDQQKTRDEHMAKAAALAPGTLLAMRAEGPKFQEKRLQIGMAAPDIEGTDLDGVSFKLSDYRGKVVVLDFWGDW